MSSESVEHPTRLEVAEMIDVRIDRHFEAKVMPMHRDNLAVQREQTQVQKDQAKEISGLGMMIREWIAEQRGVDKQKKKTSELQIELLNKNVTEATKSNARGTWALVIATIGLVILTLLSIYVAGHHKDNSLLSSDPSVVASEMLSQ